MAQLVERRIRDPEDRRFEPRLRQEHIQEKQMLKFVRVKHVVLTHYRCAPTPVCTRTPQNNHVRTLKTLQSVSESGGLWKYEKTQHAL